MKKLIFCLLIIISIIVFVKFYIYFKKYDAAYFNIKIIKSENDKDNDGVDDYMDIMLGARIDANNKVKYKSAYYAGGYPPENEGVCTDLIWRAFKNAGYNLKDLIDEDIKKNPNDYPGLDKVADPNIDFRRVSNLKVFFEKYATTLTNDIFKIENFQPGDVVIFGNNKHIGIISDKRNIKGIPFLIHNAGQLFREENKLEHWNKFEGVTGHYRWGE